jgi:hypothetical protein
VTREKVAVVVEGVGAGRERTARFLNNLSRQRCARTRRLLRFRYVVTAREKNRREKNAREEDAIFSPQTGLWVRASPTTQRGTA